MGAKWKKDRWDLMGAETGIGRASVTGHIAKWELMKEEKGDG